MPVVNINTEKTKLVKTIYTNFFKITASGLAIASLLAPAFFPCSISMATDVTSSHSKSGDTNGTVYNTAVQSITPQLGAFTTELKPDSLYVPDSGVPGSTLLYLTVTKPFNERELIEFAISATDADGDQLTYSASNLPEGASFDPNTRIFSWTPRYDQAGVYTVHFEVSDGELTDSENVSITVAQLYEDWDVNGDNASNVLDMVLIGQHWGEASLTGWIREDANEDGAINVLDMIIIGQNWGI
jgi:hypothetical protein